MKSQEINLENIKYPRRLTLEVTNACNLKCLMCARVFSDFKVKHMDWKVFEKTWPIFPYIKEVALFGWGESTIHPRFKEILQSVWKAGLDSYFNTNGFHLNRFAKLIVEGKQTYLSISLDAASADLYNKIRKGSDFNKVVNNIRLINKYKKQFNSSTPHLRFTFVAMRDNIDQLSLLADLAHELQVEAIKVVYLNAYSPKIKKQVMWHYPDLEKKNFNLLKSKARKYKLKLDLPPLINWGLKQELKTHRPCDVPWKELFVDSKGNIRLCVISTEALGNVLKDDLTKVWVSDRYNQIRKTVNSPHPVGECACCHQCNRANVNLLSTHLCYEVGIIKDRGAARTG